MPPRTAQELRELYEGTQAEIRAAYPRRRPSLFLELTALWALYTMFRIIRRWKGIR